jgi:hypothetical protein
MLSSLGFAVATFQILGCVRVPGPHTPQNLGTYYANSREPYFRSAHAWELKL